jgi:hypothetical protein
MFRADALAGGRVLPSVQRKAGRRRLPAHTGIPYPHCVTPLNGHRSVYATAMPISEFAWVCRAAQHALAAPSTHTRIAM